MNKCQKSVGKRDECQCHQLSRQTSHANPCRVHDDLARTITSIRRSVPSCVCNKLLTAWRSFSTACRSLPGPRIGPVLCTLCNFCLQVSVTVNHVECQTHSA